MGKTIILNALIVLPQMVLPVEKALVVTKVLIHA